jgi:hypothetical protein
VFSSLFCQNNTGALATLLAATSSNAAIAILDFVHVDSCCLHAFFSSSFYQKAFTEAGRKEQPNFHFTHKKVRKKSNKKASATFYPQ